MENILDYLVPLIFILAFVFPKFKKKKQKGSPSEKPPEAKKPQTGLFSKLNKMLEDYSEENKEAAKKEDEDEDSQSWWDKPYEDDEKKEEEEKVFPSVVVAAKATPPVEKTGPEKETEPVIPETIPMPGIEEYKISQKPAISQYALSKVSKKDLRKAIVWSEILAPPKALRDE